MTCRAAVGVPPGDLITQSLGPAHVLEPMARWARVVYRPETSIEGVRFDARPEEVW